MYTWIIFLRGVNVGGHNKLPMKELRVALEGAGFADVQTHIQSGNIVFRSDHMSPDSAGASVTALIETHFGFAPRSHALAAEALESAIEANPFRKQGRKDPKTVHFFFLAEAPGNKADLDALHDLKSKSERFELIGSVFYLSAPDGIGRSKLVDKIEKWIPVPMTARNMRSVYTVATLAGLDVEAL
ncbi:MAG: DUF1697 domain-containing protein [Henriciella sp.]|uniref:DUF1697 domain-containing protein n=1 Tax=Henriciella sp. TaxID=1968823 RepID=UPI003C7298E9